LAAKALPLPSNGHTRYSGLGIIKEKYANGLESDRDPELMKTLEERTNLSDVNNVSSASAQNYKSTNGG
jgi:hypothetical protein